MAVIDSREIAKVCIEQAARFGVNAHYLIAVAQLHSGFTDNDIDGTVGPYGFTLETWRKAIKSVGTEAPTNRTFSIYPRTWPQDAEVEVVHVNENDIRSWHKQCQVFAAGAARVNRKFWMKKHRSPEAAETYCIQLDVPNSEFGNISTRLGQSLDNTSSLLSETMFSLPDSFISEISAKLPAGHIIPMSTPRSAPSEEFVTNLDQNVKSGQYRVWYATNRRPKDVSDVSKGFTSEPDTRVHHGYCIVFVPASHIIGALGSPWWRRVLRGFDDRLRILSLKSQHELEFWDDVQRQWLNLDTWDRQAIIFIHGYNVSFNEAALRAAQIGYDLSINGVMAFFSWPSQGRIENYTADEDAIEQSEKQITDFMVEFAKTSGADVVHIIAHSMGNRGVLRAVDRIADSAQQKSGVRFGQIILAAADVNQSTFRSLCSAYSIVSDRTTLYVSKGDLAIQASVWLHKFSRVGLFPPVFIAPDIDTINVTNVDLSFLGHGYISNARGVLHDIYSLIHDGSPPTSRFGLESAITEKGENYWVLRK